METGNLGTWMLGHWTDSFYFGIFHTAQSSQSIYENTDKMESKYYKIY